MARMPGQEQGRLAGRVGTPDDHRVPPGDHRRPRRAGSRRSRHPVLPGPRGRAAPGARYRTPLAITTAEATTSSSSSSRTQNSPPGSCDSPVTARGDTSRVPNLTACSIAGPGQLDPGHALGESEVVLDPRRAARLPADGDVLDDNHVQPLRGAVHGGGESPPGQHPPPAGRTANRRRRSTGRRRARSPGAAGRRRTEHPALARSATASTVSGRVQRLLQGCPPTPTRQCAAPSGAGCIAGLGEVPEPLQSRSSSSPASARPAPGRAGISRRRRASSAESSTSLSSPEISTSRRSSATRTRSSVVPAMATPGRKARCRVDKPSSPTKSPSSTTKSDPVVPGGEPAGRHRRGRG